MPTSMIEVYQGPLRSMEFVRSGHCPMYPSCSHYAQEAFRLHDPVTAFRLTCDRLTRCGRDLDNPSIRWIETKSGFQVHDPVPPPEKSP